MPIGVGVNLGVERVSSLTQWSSGNVLYAADLNKLYSDSLDIPQLVYSNTQDSLDQLVSCGGLKGHGTGEANEITSTGTTLTVPADSEWFLKGYLKLPSAVNVGPLTTGTYYIFLKYDGSSVSCISSASSTRPTDVPTILIAKVVSNGSSLAIDQDDSTVDVLAFPETLDFSAASISHGDLTGLAYDDHTAYARGTGRSGGQTLWGSPDTGEDLTLGDNSSDGNTVTVTQLRNTLLMHLPLQIGDASTDLAVGNDQAETIPAPAAMDGFRVLTVLGVLRTAGVGGSLSVQIRRRRAGSDHDILSTPLTIDPGEYRSIDAASQAVVDGGYDDIETGDTFIADIDSVHTTPGRRLGLVVVCTPF
jgi:hypothetical protein